jgi:hypothetical protein
MGKLSFQMVSFKVGEFFADAIISGIFFEARIAKNAPGRRKVSSFEFGVWSVHSIERGCEDTVPANDIKNGKRYLKR